MATDRKNNCNMAQQGELACPLAGGGLCLATDTLPTGTRKRIRRSVAGMGSRKNKKKPKVVKTPAGSCPSSAASKKKTPGVSKKSAGSSSSSSTSAATKKKATKAAKQPAGPSSSAAVKKKADVAKTSAGSPSFSAESGTATATQARAAPMPMSPGGSEPMEAGTQVISDVTARRTLEDRTEHDDDEQQHALDILAELGMPFVPTVSSSSSNSNSNSNSNSSTERKSLRPVGWGSGRIPGKSIPRQGLEHMAKTADPAVAAAAKVAAEAFVLTQAEEDTSNTTRTSTDNDSRFISNVSRKEKAYEGNDNVNNTGAPAKKMGKPDRPPLVSLSGGNGSIAREMPSPAEAAFVANTTCGKATVDGRARFTGGAEKGNIERGGTDDTAAMYGEQQRSVRVTYAGSCEYHFLADMDLEEAQEAYNTASEDYWEVCAVRGAAEERLANAKVNHTRAATTMKRTVEAAKLLNQHTLQPARQTEKAAREEWEMTKFAVDEAKKVAWRTGVHDIVSTSKSARFKARRQYAASRSRCERTFREFEESLASAHSAAAAEKKARSTGEAAMEECLDARAQHAAAKETLRNSRTVFYRKRELGTVPRNPRQALNMALGLDTSVSVDGTPSGGSDSGGGHRGKGDGRVGGGDGIRGSTLGTSATRKKRRPPTSMGKRTRRGPLSAGVKELGRAEHRAPNTDAKLS